jgi:hypothetical protein
LPRFNSKFFDVGSEARDTFTVNWAVNFLLNFREKNYVNPPFSLIGEVLLHIRRCGADTCIVVPEWPGQYWWPILMEMASEWMPLSHDEGLFSPRYPGQRFPAPFWERSWAVWIKF